MIFQTPEIRNAIASRRAAIQFRAVFQTGNSSGASPGCRCAILWIMAFIVALRMLPIALLAVSAASELTNEEEIVPAGDWKYIDIPLHQKAARITAGYEVLSGSPRVRMALMLREDLERMSSDLPGSILATPEGRRGYFMDPVRRLGDYVVVLSNQDGRETARVRLRVDLDFSSGKESDIGRLSARRQLTVVAISCVAFLGIVGFSAQRLRKAMKI